MNLPIKKTCPLGHKCQEIKDNEIHQCTWFIQLAGTNPNSGEAIDEHGCSMSWMPILLIENAQQQRSTSAAVESFRNDVAASVSGLAQLAINQMQIGVR
jgi:hypothetical protein